MKKAVLLACTVALLATSWQPAAARERGQRDDAGQEAAQTRDDRRERNTRDNRERREERNPRENRRERGRGDAQAAARTAQRLNGGGRVLSVNPEGDGYQVRLLKDGEVRSYFVPAD